jgi:hypothetical protein
VTHVEPFPFHSDQHFPDVQGLTDYDVTAAKLGQAGWHRSSSYCAEAIAEMRAVDVGREALHGELRTVRLHVLVLMSPAEGIASASLSAAALSSQTIILNQLLLC